MPTRRAPPAVAPGASGLTVRVDAPAFAVQRVMRWASRSTIRAATVSLLTPPSVLVDADPRGRQVKVTFVAARAPVMDVRSTAPRAESTSAVAPTRTPSPAPDARGRSAGRASAASASAVAATTADFVISERCIAAGQ